MVLSALYMARVTFVVFFGRSAPENDRAHESPLVMTVPLILLAFFALTVGFIAFNWTDSYQGFGGFLGEGRFHLNPWLTVVSLALALGGVGMGWLVYVKGSVSHHDIAQRFSTLHRVLVDKYYIDDIYQWVIDRVVLAFGNFVAVFDRIVVNDTAVDGSAFTVMLSALRLRYAQTGRMYNYGMAMVLGVVALVLIWWIVLK